MRGPSRSRAGDAMSLTSLNEVKIALGIDLTNTKEDATLTALQGGVEAALERLTNRKFASANYTEYYNGTNSNVLVLNQTPVYTITSVAIDRSGRWGQNTDGFPTSSVIATDGYYLQKDGPAQAYSESGILIRVEDNWLGFRTRPLDLLTLRIVPGQGNVRVLYTAGYPVIPNDVKLAIWEAVGELRNRKKWGFGTGVLTGESLSASSYSLSPMDMQVLLRIGTVAQILATYTKPVI